MKSVLFASHAQGLPVVENFSFREEPKPVLTEEGSFLVKILYISVDPYMRGRMNVVSPVYTTPFQIGEPISGGVVGEVVESKNSKYEVGSFVSAFANYSEYVIFNESAAFLTKLNLPKELLSHALGVAGMPGLTAYFGFVDICQPKAGETLVVSGAAGAVGSYVVQLGKLHGCRVIGIAGSEDKCKVLTEELGADAAINYKTDNVLEKLKEYAPNKIDIYFDNVGGDITDAVFSLLNVRARVSSCGAISAYNKTEDVGPRPWFSIISKGIKVQGFVVTRDFGHKWGEGVEYMTKLITENKIKAKETVDEGIEKVPEALIKLFTGANIGKQIVKLY